MPPEQITISAVYFNALQDVRRCAEALDMANAGSDEWVKAEDDLQCALGHLAILEGEDNGQEAS